MTGVTRRVRAVWARDQSRAAPQLEDRQPRRRRIVGPLLGFDLLHAGVLDADLLTQERDFVPEPLDLGPEPEARVEALGGPTEGGGQGEIGKGDGVHCC